MKFNENEREWNPFVELSLTPKIGKIYVFAIDKSTNNRHVLNKFCLATDDRKD